MLPTIIVAAIIALVFCSIIVSEIKNKKNGKCSCGCSGCGMRDICHNQKQN